MPVNATIRTFAALAMVAVPAAVMAQSRDVTVEMTESLMLQMYAPSRDGARTVATLRATKEAELLPLFEKLAQHENAELARAGMISAAMITGESARLDLAKAIPAGDDKSPSNAIVAMLIESGVLSDAQLQEILSSSKDAVAKVMVASELVRRKATIDAGAIKDLMGDEKDEVRYYAALTLIEHAGEKRPADVKLALETLNALSGKRLVNSVPVQMLMVVRVRKDKIGGALPWVEAVAKDEKLDGVPNGPVLRRTALSTLMAMKHGSAGEVYGSLAKAQTDVIPQLELAMLAIEFPEGLKTDHMATFANSRSKLVRTLGGIAGQAVGGADFSKDLLRLMKDGDPIVLKWALVYAEHAPEALRLPLRAAVVQQATIVDDQRKADFERAAMAAQAILEADTKEGHAALAEFLKSDNHAVVEATLAGLARSEKRSLAELVMPFWERFSARPSSNLTPAANYAALLLAREGKKEPRRWLAGMVQGGNLSSLQDLSFRVLAGWYYAKLGGEGEGLVKRVAAKADVSGK